MTEPRIGTDVERAVDILRSGGIVGLPTETVYGLGADASNADAVARVFRVKGRPTDHPLIVHVLDVDAARQWSRNWSPEADLLARAFWPGPLTIIVDRAPQVSDAVTGGRDTVALRSPSHPAIRAVLASLGGGIAAPSANRFGKVSPTTARHVLDDLGPDVDYVLDGGPCAIGLESTIVDCSVHPCQILRPGGISESDIRRILDTTAEAHGPSRAPGMLESHYAPDCRVHPVETMERALSLAAELAASDSDSSGPEILDASVDPVRFASTMYARLRDLDRAGRHDVIVVLPDDTGIGKAIRDRIVKASHGNR